MPSVPAKILPASTTRGRILFAILGAAVAILALWAQVEGAGGDLAVILRVGDESGTRDFIESELGPVPLTRGLGHDGQYFYLIARDPLGLDGLPDLADDGPYRYRRALYGWLAGIGGLSTPELALKGLAAWAILGVVVASGAAAELASLSSAKKWATLGIVANLGLILSVQLATSDTVAMASAILGVVFVMRRRWVWAIVALAAAALAKDVYLLFALGLGGWLFFTGERRSGLGVAAIPSLAMVTWIAWLQWLLGGALSAKGNISAPFGGLIESFPLWDTRGDLILALLALFGLVGATISLFLVRHRLFTWLVVPWAVLALVSSAVVWGDGNNAIRVFAPLWLFAIWGLAWWRGDRSAGVISTGASTSAD